MFSTTSIFEGKTCQKPQSIHFSDVYEERSAQYKYFLFLSNFLIDAVKYINNINLVQFSSSKIQKSGPFLPSFLSMFITKQN